MRFFITILVMLTAGMPALAQTTTQTFVIGGGGAVQFAPDQKTMLEAGGAATKGDYSSANSLYSQAIALNNSNFNAYLQRAVVRRELGDASGMEADANTVINIVNQRLESEPGNPNLYYARGMGYRLLKDYDKAKADITKGMRVGGKRNWQTDLKAIELERKIAD